MCGVATTAVEIDSIAKVNTNSGSSSASSGLATPTKLRFSVGGLDVGLDVRFRVLMGSDKSAVSMSRILGNQISSGLLGGLLEHEVRSRFL
jgi:hypothetical protein